MKRNLKFRIIFNIVSILVVLISLWLLLIAFFMSGVGSIFPLWGRLLGFFVLLWVLSQHQTKRIILQTVEGKTPKRQLILYAIKRIIFIVVGIIIITVWHEAAHQKYLQKLFKEFFNNISVQKVTLIEGTFFRWMDWHGSLTFKTDKNIFNEIIKDYDSVGRDQLERHYFDAEIMNNPDIKFYHKEVKLDDKMYEDYYLGWNKEKQTVYFYVSNIFY